ncbi:MAG: DUF4279 domain-containing protein [Janthinobacterium lividum]
MKETELIAVAVEEIESPTFGVIEQFLEVHEVDYKDAKPVVAGVKTDTVEKVATVYFSVKGEHFYFAVYLDIEPRVRVRFAGTEDFCQVYFSAYSEALTLQELSNLTALEPTESYDKGDKLIRNLIAGGSSVKFRPNLEPDTFSSKLKSLLAFLERDIRGIRRLANEASGSIAVYTIFHNGTNMLGGFHLDKSDIQRLAALNLEIDFDLYVSGNLFKDPTD